MGELVERKGSEDIKNEYDIRFINESHLPQILQLQDTIVEKIADPTSYCERSYEYLYPRLIVENGGVGIFKGEELLAYHVTSFPGLDDEELGSAIGLTPAEIVQTVKMGPTGVHPEYRNLGLLYMAAKKHFKIIGDMGYRHICLTIAPNNYPSLVSTLKHGFVIKQFKQKYNKYLRYVMHLDLKKRQENPRYVVKIASTDIESQRFMLQLGFYGYAIARDKDGLDIIFGAQQKTGAR